MGIAILMRHAPVRVGFVWTYIANSKKEVEF